ncbi:dehydration-responsive element-binding protein 1D-like [Macadamia integrifolia]|uniref:dehydration-responsive element-binding protein 1D-like n=1 Tax=Macadamia integrifolia TaxID=60698 RepID=UPI001C4FA2F3|nr:dehydration-responsive element-binding protein 1D-like [Macadamia integrifolia]
MEIYEDQESSASSSCSDVVVLASLTNSTMVTTHKRKAGRKKFKETRHPIFRGVRERNKGKWVCEVREPNKKSRIWLGTYPSPDMAARAYDVAAIALRGKSATLNFLDSTWLLPRAKSATPKDIQLAALQAAESFRPASTTTTICSPSSSSSSLSFTNPVDTADELPHVEEQEKQGENVKTSATTTPPTTSTFIDEEALFNMPGLLESMAEGMLLTPPSMKQRFNWDDMDRHIDSSLWTD